MLMRVAVPRLITPTDPATKTVIFSSASTPKALNKNSDMTAVIVMSPAMSEDKKESETCSSQWEGLFASHLPRAAATISSP